MAERYSPAMKPTLKPGEARRVSLSGLACRCARCGHVWTVAGRLDRAPEVPTWCASCKSPAWRTKPGTVRMGRPPASE